MIRSTVANRAVFCLNVRAGNSGRIPVYKNLRIKKREKMASPCIYRVNRKRYVNDTKDCFAKNAFAVSGINPNTRR